MGTRARTRRSRPGRNANVWSDVGAAQNKVLWGTNRADVVKSAMRLLIGFCLSVTILATGCSSEQTQADVGIDPADVANEVPYGQGAEVGVTYDYALYVHCGVEWARIDGVWWRTEALNDGNANPPGGWGNPYQRGKLTLEERDIADFEGPEGVVEFERTELADVPYECE